MSHSSITVVVINYNYAQFVKDAIESLLHQEQPFNEIIVVNDGSTDNSLEVINAYSDQITILTITNSGQLGPAIASLELVSTDYVYFLDADDYVEHNLTKRLMSYFQHKPVKIQFQLNGVDENRKPLSSIFPIYPSGYNAKKMCQDNQNAGFYICPPTSGNIYCVSALRSLRLSELNSRDFVDGTPVLVMPYLGEIVSVSEVLANYRVHGESDSQYFCPTPDLL